MIRSIFLQFSVILIVMVNFIFAQEIRRDNGIYGEKKNEFYERIEAAADSFREEKEEPEMKFMMDFSGYDLPKSKDQFKSFWHNEPISQGISGMCWCFSTTSYFESEIYRLSKNQIKLSELYTVYWEYVEKARRFVQERGDSEFGEGSESNAVKRIWKKYGIVPADIYTGLKPEQKFHDHRQLYEEMNNSLQYVKTNNLWDEETVISTIKSMLNHYLGVPPSSFEYQGKKYTPLEFLQKEVKLKLDDYIDFLSLKQQPYYQKVEFEVPDNWWLNKDYHNIPLDEFMSIIKKAVRNNYSLCIGGDVSEPGYDSHHEVAMVPSFDIPAQFIDENARQLRFSNKSTEDDHGIHIVGYLEKDGKDWYLIKDSGSGSRNGPNFGYYFYQEDYVKLKMLIFVIHKDLVTDILKKFESEN
jgi:bleomycin hydrolase